MNKLFLIGFMVVAIAALSVRAECVDGEFKQPTTDNEGENKDSDLSLFIKKVGCSIKHGAGNVKEESKKLGVKIKEGARKFKESAKKFGSNIKTKLREFKDKLSDSSKETTAKPNLFANNVELINPDTLRAEQKCGHGYILDVLGDCKKL